jgi:hypothetical protein
MTRRAAILGAFTLVIVAVAIVSAALASWYWAAATELLILIWFGLTLVIQRSGRNTGDAPRH